MEWFPIVFFTFKVLALGTGMFFAVKWHYDQGKKDKDKKNKDKKEEMRAVLRGGAKAVVIFVLALVVVGLVTVVLIRTFGM